MTNLVLFAATIVLYFGVYYLYLGKKPEVDRKTNLSILAWITLLSLPVNINGHVLTVFGNAVGEKGVYSIASLYQRADDNNGNAFALLSSGYQRANDTFTMVGISGYQRAGASAITAIGVSGYQQANFTVTFCGVSGYQRAGRNVATIIGVSVYQRAGEGRTETFFGVSVYQRAGTDAVTTVGVSGYQRAGNKASTVIGLAFYQKVKEQSRAFAVWSPLKAEQAVKQK